MRTRYPDDLDPSSPRRAPHRRVARWLPLVLAAALLFWVPPALAQEQTGTLATASFPLFAVDGSGVTGQLQVLSAADGSTSYVLSTFGLQDRGGNGTFAAAIYHGDCGPDRALALQLVPLGTAPNDPYASTTQTRKLSFDEVTQGNYFVYLFAGDQVDTPDQTGLDAQALACGEVGKGATR